MRVTGALLPLAFVAGCGGNWENHDVERSGDDGASSAPAPLGLHAVGNRIEDADGNTVVLHGVNRSGTEYQCAKNVGFFDGPDSEASIQVMKEWKINAVRVPLNESCWLGKAAVAPLYAGEPYQNEIRAYVSLLQAHGLVPILDLHWAAPGETLAGELRPMPNADNSPGFWASVATTFLDNDGVVLELYNEPFPDLNKDTDAAWDCWQNGCETNTYAGETYAAAGMQSLVDAVRDAGSTHLLLLGGVQYSNGLTQWLARRPDDPVRNIGAAWHVYNNNACRDVACFDGVPAEVAREVPVVATEIGQNDCNGESFLSPLMGFLDQHAAGYLAWSWNASSGCDPAVPRMSQGRPWFLIASYDSSEPNSDYARTFRDHLAEVVP